MCLKALIYSLAIAMLWGNLPAQSLPQPVLQQGRRLAEAPSQEGTLVLEVLVRGLNTPHSAAWIPLRAVAKSYSQLSGGVWLISEQSGGVWVLYQKKLYPLQGLPRDLEVRGGYLDLLYNPWLGRVFLSYTKKLGPHLSTVAVVAFSLVYGTQEEFSALHLQQVFQAQPTLRFSQKTPLDYGASLAATQEFLYIGLGGRQIHQLPEAPPQNGKSIQNAANDWGSVHKLSLRHTRQSLESRLPSTAISTGHGNILGLTWDPYDHRLWSVENIARSQDELNQILEGRNYSQGGARQPKLSSLNSAAWSGWSHLLVLPPKQSSTANLFRKWAGNLLLSSLQGQSLYRLAQDADPTAPGGFRIVLLERMLGNYLGPLRWLGLGPDGAIYLLSYGRSGGSMLRLSPKSRQFPIR